MSSKNLFEGLRRQGEVLCWICHEPIDNAEDFSKDHVRPKSKGGRGLANLRPAHKWCNKARGDDPTDTWFAELHPDLLKIMDDWLIKGKYQGEN